MSRVRNEKKKKQDQMHAACMHVFCVQQHVEAEGDASPCVSLQCKQTCLRRGGDICCMLDEPKQCNMAACSLALYGLCGRVSPPGGLAHGVPGALAQELLANSCQNRKLPNTKEERSQHRTLHPEPRCCMMETDKNTSSPASPGRRDAAAAGSH